MIFFVKTLYTKNAILFYMYRFFKNYILYLFLYRCTDVGKYSMTGNSIRTCIHSEWTGQKPVCFGLNQENDYASKVFLIICII